LSDTYLQSNSSCRLVGLYDDQDYEPYQPDNHESDYDFYFHVSPVHHSLELLGVFLEVHCICYTLTKIYISSFPLYPTFRLESIGS
jgi:hypothetical protein